MARGKRSGLNKYFRKGGKGPSRGRSVMAKMRKRYGKDANHAFYGTINNMRKGSKKQKAAQPKRAPGSGRRRGRKR